MGNLELVNTNCEMIMSLMGLQCNGDLEERENLKTDRNNQI